MNKTFFAAAVAVVAVMATSCGGSEEGFITMGNSSKMDSLSYSMGANIAYGMSAQMGDVPLNFESISEGVKAGAFDKAELTQDDAIATLRDYFETKYPERRAKVAEERRVADSVAIAGGADPEAVAEANAALKADASMFESEAERTEVSYAFGVNLGINLQTVDFPLQVVWLTNAMTDVNAGSPVIDQLAARAFLTNYFEVVRPAEQMAEQEAALAKIAKQKGVITTESGLMYRIEKEGEALHATDDRDVVEVFYTGKSIRTDKVFDTNRFADRPEEQKEAMLAQNPDAATADAPISFPLNRVIPGWTEGMKLVGKGGRISLWIPSDLAYGERGSGGVIGANEALYFDVELVEVTPHVEEPAAE
ncbi:MAG: FKBP-type peptidyl-prolyl cis-trans isomerase N-terminal domain-containing protein [Rikenellaceae bacterium]